MDNVVLPPAPEPLFEIGVPLKDADIAVSSVSYGASDTTCLISIPEDKKDEAVKAVYDGLFL